MRLTKQGVRDLGDVRAVGPAHRRSPVTVIHDGRPRLAVDVCVSDREIRELEAAGFYVAVVAEDGEPDANWLTRAAAAMVDIVCSADKEVGIWAHDREVIFVRLNGNKKSAVLSKVRAAWRSR